MKNTLKFKTNINCGGCVAKVTPVLDANAGPNQWNVDTTQADKVLTVEADGITEQQIITAVQSTGFKIEPLKNPGSPILQKIKSIFSVWILLLLANIAWAQNNPTGQLLDSYLAIKNSLVTSNEDSASASANSLVKLLNSTDAAQLPAIEQKAYALAKPKLLKEAKTIANSGDLASQRSAFAALSKEIWPLVKSSTNITGKVYYQYCPMKKAYWLSRETEIQNPYYGSQMLTCGNVSDKKE